MTLLLLASAKANTLTELLGLQRKLDHLVRNQVVAEGGLTMEQFAILVELEGTLSFGSPGQSLHDIDGYVGFAELAERLTLTKPGLSRRLADLERRGWVKQRSASEARLADKDQPHGNAHVVRITSEGRKQAAPVVKGMLNLDAELFRGVTLKQRRAFCEVLDLLWQRVQQRLRKREHNYAGAA